MIPCESNHNFNCTNRFSDGYAIILNNTPKSCIENIKKVKQLLIIFIWEFKSDFDLLNRGITFNENYLF